MRVRLSLSLSLSLALSLLFSCARSLSLTLNNGRADIRGCNGSCCAVLIQRDGPRLATFKSDEVAEMMLPAPKAFTRAITGTLVPTEGRGDVAGGGGSARAGVGAGVGSRRYSEVEGDNTDIEDGLDLENSRLVPTPTHLHRLRCRRTFAPGTPAGCTLLSPYVYVCVCARALACVRMCSRSFLPFAS